MRDTLLKARNILLSARTSGAEALYADWYHRTETDVIHYPTPSGFRAAMADPVRYESGWLVVRPSPHAVAGVVVQSGGIERATAPPECFPENSGQIDMHNGVAMCVDPLAANLSGGFWHVWSVAWQQKVPDSLVRLYLSVTSGLETDACMAATRALPPLENWSIKFLSGQHHAGRCDPVVAYFDKSQSVDSDWVLAFVQAMSPFCEGARPPFTKSIAKGISWATDPGNGESYGQWLCRIIASCDSAELLNDPSLWLETVHSTLVKSFPTGYFDEPE